MKILLLSITLLATATLFLFCKQPKYTADVLPDKQVRWGSGGGFVGRETKYILLENGQIFKVEAGGKFTEQKKTKSGKAKSLFSAAKALEMGKMNFEHPGNMYDFMEYQEGGATQRISWGDVKYPVNAQVKDLFAQLNDLVKQ